MSFELAEDLVVAALHVMGDAPDVDRRKAAERANVNGRRVRAGLVAAPLAAVTEQGGSADVDVDALRDVDVDVAEASKNGYDGPRVVDFGFTQIQIKIPESTDGQSPASQP